MRGEDSERHALSIPCHAERPLPNARRQNQQAHPRATRTPGSMGTTARKRRLSAEAANLRKLLSKSES
jgi:hypothetical protein